MLPFCKNWIELFFRFSNTIYLWLYHRAQAKVCPKEWQEAGGVGRQTLGPKSWKRIFSINFKYLGLGWDNRIINMIYLAIMTGESPGSSTARSLIRFFLKTEQELTKGISGAHRIKSKCSINSWFSSRNSFQDRKYSSRILFEGSFLKRWYLYIKNSSVKKASTRLESTGTSPGIWNMDFICLLDFGLF